MHSVSRGRAIESSRFSVFLEVFSKFLWSLLKRLFAGLFCGFCIFAARAFISSLPYTLSLRVSRIFDLGTSFSFPLFFVKLWVTSPGVARPLSQELYSLKYVKMSFVINRLFPQTLDVKRVSIVVQCFRHLRLLERPREIVLLYPPLIEKMAVLEGLRLLICYPMTSISLRT